MSETNQILRACARIIDQTSIDTPETTTMFDCDKPPRINMEAYLHRFVKYAGCTTDTVILGLVYIVRCVVHIQESLKFSVNSRHCILLTCLWIAIRYLEDRPPEVGTFAAVGGVSTKELIAMERNMLKRMDFRLYVTQEKFDKYKRRILTWNK